MSTPDRLTNGISGMRNRSSLPSVGFAAAGPRPPGRPHPFHAAGALKPRKRLARLQWFFVALLGIGGLFASDRASAATPAESFVQSSIDKSYALLNDRTLDAVERQSRFGEQLRSMVDTSRVALFTLGPYGRNVSRKDLEGFSTAFGDFLTAVYQQALVRYKSDTVRVTGSTARSDGDFVVNVLIERNGRSDEIHVAFRVRRSNEGEFAVMDLQAEGAWLALTQRADFISYLQQHGGDIELLSKEIELRAERIRTALTD